MWLATWEGRAFPDSYQPDSFENIQTFLPLDWLIVFTDGLASRWSGGAHKAKGVGQGHRVPQTLFPP